MRGSRPGLLAATLCFVAAFTPPPASSRLSSEAATGAGEARATATQPRGVQTSTVAPPAKRKVWTKADLEALRHDPSAQILVLESRRIGGPAVDMQRQPAVQPQEVVDRYDLLAKEADAKLIELARERLAASNPYLRGLASQTGGPRKREEIEADIARWTSRRDSAKANLERASKLTGVSTNDDGGEP